MKGTVPAGVSNLNTGCTQIKNNLLYNSAVRKSSDFGAAELVRESNVSRCEHILFAKNAKKMRKLLDTLSTANIISVNI